MRGQPFSQAVPQKTAVVYKRVAIGSQSCDPADVQQPARLKTDEGAERSFGVKHRAAGPPEIARGLSKGQHDRQHKNAANSEDGRAECARLLYHRGRQGKDASAD